MPDGIYYSDGVQKPDVYFDQNFMKVYEKYDRTSLQLHSEKEMGELNEKLSFYAPFYPKRRIVDAERLIVLSTDNSNEKIIFFEKFIDNTNFFKIIIKINTRENSEININNKIILIRLIENDKKNKIRIKISEYIKGDGYMEKIIKKKDYVFIEKVEKINVKDIVEFENNIYLNNEKKEMGKYFEIKTPIYDVSRIIDKSGGLDVNLEHIYYTTSLSHGQVIWD
jgi:hypothetical protein